MKLFILFHGKQDVMRENLCNMLFHDEVSIRDVALIEIIMPLT